MKVSKKLERKKEQAKRYLASSDCEAGAVMGPGYFNRPDKVAARANALAILGLPNWDTDPLAKKMGWSKERRCFEIRLKKKSKPTNA